MNKVAPILLGILTATGGYLDAGTISTSSSAGASFGLGLLWPVLLGTAAVVVLIESAGRLAAVSGKPYAAAIRERFGFSFWLLPLTADLIASALLLGADLGGVATGIGLLIGHDWRVLLPVAFLVVWAFAWRAPFGLIENGPSLLGLVALSFVVAIPVLADRGSPELLDTFVKPRIGQGELASYLFLVAAMLGATIQPYLVTFYSSGAREERWTRRTLVTNRVASVLGMGFGMTTSIGLVAVCALVLGPAGVKVGSLPEIGLTLAAAFGQVGGILFAIVLVACCLGAGLEVVLAIGYEVSQGFGWEWGEEKPPVEAPRFNLVLTVFLVVALGLAFLVGDPLQLALLGSVAVALFLPLSLAPFLVLMNDPDYAREERNGMLMNVATGGVLVLAFAVAVVSVPLLFLSGGG
ncbi:MAG TPA: divalent metal cation transporter [Candidatus Limnocylindrales bacterium]